MGVLSSGVESQVFLGADVPLTQTVDVSTLVGLQRHFDGRIDARDALLLARWTVVSTPTAWLRISPGVSIPTGGLGSRLLFTPMSSASVDPWIGVDSTVGSNWILGTSALARVPVYDGWDRIRQGPFVRADLRGARRLGDHVVWVGVGYVNQAQADRTDAAPSFAAVSGFTGAVFALGERTSLIPQVRIPAWSDEDSAPFFSGGVSMRWVLGTPAAKKDED